MRQRLLQFALRLGVLRELRWAARNPVESQARVLRALLSAASSTEWGRRYSFSKLLQERNIVDAYQARMPLHTYDQLRDDIARMRDGEADVLWPGRINYFAASSGTSSKSKELPVSEAELARFLRFGRQIMASYIAETGSLSCLRGTPVFLAGRLERDPHHPEVLVGEIAGLAAEYAAHHGHLGRIRFGRKTLPTELRYIVDFEQKLTRLIEFSMDRDVRMLVMMPSWGLRFLDKLVESYNKKHGSHVTTVSEIWPNLQLLIGGGVPLRLYRDLIQERIGLPRMQMLEMYGASESSFAFQQSLDDPALLLHTHNGVFFEFVRRDESGTPDPRRYTVADVEVNVDYVLYVSTCSGLWAYCMDDVVRFTQTFPHKLTVVGRASEVLDSYTECVTGSQLRDAVEFSAAQLGVRPLEFHVSPLPAQKQQLHAHQWLIEFDQTPPDVAKMAQLLDQRLQQRNVTYACCRLEKGMGIPVVVPIPRGSFHAWIEESRGAVHSQTKVPVLSGNRDFSEGVLSGLPSGG